MHASLKSWLSAAVLLAATSIATAQGSSDLLRIGYQKSASLLALQKAPGTLEKRLAAQGVSVKWVEFPAGPQLLEGLNVGAVEVGYVGEAPPIFAQAAGANLSQAAALIAPLQGLETDVVELSLKRYQFGVAPVTAAVGAEQQKIADAFHELTLIPKSVRIADALPGAATTAQATK